MRVLALIFLTGCATPLSTKTLYEYARVLEATKSAYYATCIQLPKPAEVEARCILADAHLTAAIEMYSELRVY